MTEPAIIAACVAGIVSVLGLVVQLLIARQTHHAQRQQAAMNAKIKLSMDVVSGLRALESDTEAVRIAAWQTLTALDAIGPPPICRSDPGVSRLAAAVATVGTKSTDFLSSWADVKYDVHEEVSDYLRDERHRCRKHLTGLRAIGELLEREARSTSLTDLPPQVFSDLRRYVEDLMDSLDRFGRGVTSARRLALPSNESDAT